MRSIKHRMCKIQKANPDISSYLHFKWAITGQKFTQQIIARNFNELVEKSDYDHSVKKELLAELYALSKGVEENKK